MGRRAKKAPVRYVTLRSRTSTVDRFRVDEYVVLAFFCYRVYYSLFGAHAETARLIDTRNRTHCFSSKFLVLSLLLIIDFNKEASQISETIQMSLLRQ
jgi:hypothetical protein